MKFSEISLVEVNMSPSALKKTSKVDALCGIEFEMVMPAGAPVPIDDPGMSDISSMVDFFKLDTILARGVNSQLTTLFDRRAPNDHDINRFWIRNAADMVDLYAKTLWASPSARAVFAQTHLNDSTDQDADFHLMTKSALYNPASILYKAARANYLNRADMYDKQITDSMKDTEDTEDAERAWAIQTFGNMRTLSKKYALPWPSFDIFWTQTSADFASMIGKTVVVNTEYHSTSKKHGGYTMEPDASIKVGKDEMGVEWVSPPMKLDDMISDLKKIIKWSHDKGARTNSSTGLHCNVSVPNFKDFDYVKLVLFLGDRYILEQFGREMNTYCESALAKLNGRLADQTDNTVAHLLDMIKFGGRDVATKILSDSATEKYSSIHVHGADNYVEFRSPGGDWLNTDINILVTTLRRFVVAVDIACDKTKYKDEYNKKLYKMLSSSTVPTEELVYSPEDVKGRLNLFTMLRDEGIKFKYTGKDILTLIDAKNNRLRAADDKEWLLAINDIEWRLRDEPKLHQYFISQLEPTYDMMDEYFSRYSMRKLLQDINEFPEHSPVWEMLLTQFRNRRDDTANPAWWWPDITSILPADFKYSEALRSQR